MIPQALRPGLIRTLGVGLVFTSVSVSAQRTYRLSDLGTLGGSTSHVSAINLRIWR